MKSDLLFTFFSVCTPEYLKYANACYHSLSKHNSNFEYVILLIGGKNESKCPSSSYPFKIIGLEDLSDNVWREMQLRYDTFELCNALRPVLARELLLQASSELLVYLDVDIYVTGSFNNLLNLTKEKSFFLSPHILQPYPLDGSKPDDLTLTTLGVYNIGFWVIRRNEIVLKMLDYLVSRNKVYCYNQPPLMFTGQTFLPLFLSLFSTDCGQINDPAYNIAYWNLHERKISESEGNYFIEDRPAVFFHFSGFDGSQPEKLTRWPFRDCGNLPLMLRALGEYLELAQSSKMLRS